MFKPFSTDFMHEFNTLKKNLKKDFTGLKKVRVALLGDTATQLLNQALTGAGYDSGYSFEIWEADFNQIERQIFDVTSELYQFQPELVVIFKSSHKLLAKYNKIKDECQSSFASGEISLIEQLNSSLNSSLRTKVIYFNYPEIDDSVFGSYANKVPSSFLFQLRKLNYELMVFASQHPEFYICDLSAIQNEIGKSNLFHPSIYINTEMVISIRALPYVASKVISLIDALSGKFKKCVVLDLDNTIWGGIIGDDGMENIQIGSLGIGKAFSEFQYWIRKLKKRGVIVAVCSKNMESIAKEPFLSHPDMVLKLEDIAVFIANWDNKPDNIRQIQKILNIGFDSMVFLDDNPFERNIVRENIPCIAVPELPEDPADYLEFLYSLNLFETASYSDEDAERTKQYQTEAQRSSLQQGFTNEDDFLKSLQMVSVIEPFNKFNSPRVAQLSQRSNQFNLRTTRYTEGDIEKLLADDNYDTFTFSLSDKFGDNGLICAVILKRESFQTAFIDTWFMSCRVLKRGIENLVLNTLVNYTKEKGYEFLRGEYIPTPKNALVKDHYPNLGFKKDGNSWLLSLSDYQDKKTLIKSEYKWKEAIF
ncbi:MAG TPA: HAD-IIIC family phosphatase [Sphingobacteriaceae bacterium]